MKKKRFSWNNIFITASMAMVVFLLLLFAGSSLVTAAEDVDYESLYTYYGLPFYSYGSSNISCEDGMLDDERYTSCEKIGDVNKYSYTLAGFKEIYDLNDPRVVCHLDASLGGCSPDPEEKFSYSVPRAGQRDVPDAFRLYIPPGTINVTVSMHMSISCMDGVVVRYRSTPDCSGWPYGRNDAVPWDSQNIGLDVMEDRDVYKVNSGGTILVVPPTYRSKDDEGGWLYVRRLGLDDREIDTVTIKVTVNTEAFLTWYNSMGEQQHDWDANGDPWGEHKIISTTRPSYTPPSSTVPPSNTAPPSSTAPPSGNLLLSGNDVFSSLGISFGLNSIPTSTDSTPTSVTTSLFGLPVEFGVNYRSEQLSCGPDHLKVCDREACEGLGVDYWWYEGSCRTGQQYEEYVERIPEAPVRLGADANDGLISIGEGMSVEVDVPDVGRTYAMLVFPNGDYFFIDNDTLITKDVVPVFNGVMFVSDDICAALAELPEDIKGEWELLIFTVPTAAPEFRVIEDIASYIENEGVYHFGSYSVMVTCQARSNNPLSIFGVSQ